MKRRSEELTCLRLLNLVKEELCAILTLMCQIPVFPFFLRQYKLLCARQYACLEIAHMFRFSEIEKYVPIYPNARVVYSRTCERSSNGLFLFTRRRNDECLASWSICYLPEFLLGAMLYLLEKRVTIKPFEIESEVPQSRSSNNKNYHSMRKKRKETYISS